MNDPHAFELIVVQIDEGTLIVQFLHRLHHTLKPPLGWKDIIIISAHAEGNQQKQTQDNAALAMMFIHK
jgi:hypothetical protein